MVLSDQLRQLLTGEVQDDLPTLTTYSRDASIYQIQPQAVVFPKDSHDLETLVTFVRDHHGMSLTPRSAGTDMSGGAINDSIIVDMTRHFNQIISVNAQSAVAQPGVFYRDFEKETLKYGSLLPCYTASRELNTVGGMVANNSAGEKTLSYGQTERYVKRLKVVLADGKEYTLGPVTLTQLQSKMAEQSYEAEIYRRMYYLIESNWGLIKNARPKTSKNSTGYNVWDVWNGETFDLTKIFTGSQGTLGFITEIEFALVPHKPFESNLVLELHDMDQLNHIVSLILHNKPESFECFDDQTLGYSVKFLSELIKEFKLSHGLGLYFKFIKEIVQSDFGLLPKLVLIAGFTGATQQEAALSCQNAAQALAEIGIKSRIMNPKEAEKYWVMRRNSFNLLRHHSEKMKTAPFIDDIIVQPHYLPDFLPRLNKILEPYRNYMIYTIAGHIGDGNFHIIPLMDFENPITAQIIPEIAQKVYDLVFEFQGSMSAEHNDGLVRGPYLPQMYGNEVFQIFKQIKEIFDPHHIFNPHKKTEATLEYALGHIMKA